MKRKVFSLMMLCLLAFLGVASAQQDGGMTVTPDRLILVTVLLERGCVPSR